MWGSCCSQLAAQLSCPKAMSLPWPTICERVIIGVWACCGAAVVCVVVRRHEVGVPHLQVPYSGFG